LAPVSLKLAENGHLSHRICALGVAAPHSCLSAAAVWVSALWRSWCSVHGPTADGGGLLKQLGNAGPGRARGRGTSQVIRLASPLDILFDQDLCVQAEFPAAYRRRIQVVSKPTATNAPMGIQVRPVGPSLFSATPPRNDAEIAAIPRRVEALARMPSRTCCCWVTPRRASSLAVPSTFPIRQSSAASKSHNNHGHGRQP
jgi:hypothetical protein